MSKRKKKRNRGKNKSAAPVQQAAAATAASTGVVAQAPSPSASVRQEARKRRGSRRGKQQQQKQRLIAGIVGLAGVAVLAFVLFGAGGGSTALAVPQERLELDPVRGDPNAPVTIVEYAAFSCPACRAWHNAGIIEGILAQYEGQVKFVFRDFPVITPSYDRMSGEIAQCALDQGQAEFWLLHDALYEIIRPGTSRAEIIRTAGVLGLDTDALTLCSEEGTHRDTVRFDDNRARNLGLPGTPSWLVNDQRLFQAAPETLQAAIEQALAQS